jgi:HTH-type transcriptional regulator/antitoxin MqsA
MEYSECPVCHEEIVTPEQIKRSEVRIRDEHRKIDGLLTSAEIVQLRNRLNIIQSQVSQVFGDGVMVF